MSGKISKSQIPILPRISLPPDASIALIEAKNLIRAGAKLKLFENKQGRTPLEGSPLPGLSDGCTYYEHRVGRAHPGDPLPGGVRRLVFEVNDKSRQILEVYFTDEHYGKGSLVRVV